jgi:hypothetical protein
MTEPETTHRRDFVKAVALVGSAAALTRPAMADDDKDKDKKDEPKPKSEVDARMDLILARYGSSLDDEAKKSVRSEVETIVRRGEQLRKFALTNGDEPFPVFTPYRAPLA